MGGTGNTGGPCGGTVGDAGVGTGDGLGLAGVVGEGPGWGLGVGPAGGVGVGPVGGVGVGPGVGCWRRARGWGRGGPCRRWCWAGCRCRRWAWRWRRGRRGVRPGRLRRWRQLDLVAHKNRVRIPGAGRAALEVDAIARAVRVKLRIGRQQLAQLDLVAVGNRAQRVVLAHRVLLLIAWRGRGNRQLIALRWRAVAACAGSVARPRWWRHMRRGVGRGGLAWLNGAGHGAVLVMWGKCGACASQSGHVRRSPEHGKL